MLQIRKGTFETNSSSTHSIVVASDSDYKKHDIVFGIGEYGWGWEVLDTPGERASYLYTCLCDISGQDRAQDIVRVLKSHGIDCCIDPKPVFETWSDGGRTFLDNGYVDHCCEAQDFVDAMLADEDLMMRFIFNDKSFVIVSNDNVDEEEYEEFNVRTDVEYPHTTFYKGN